MLAKATSQMLLLTTCDIRETGAVCVKEGSDSEKETQTAGVNGMSAVHKEALNMGLPSASLPNSVL